MISSRESLRIGCVLLALLLWAGPLTPATSANPQDGTVVSGEAKFGGSEIDLVIETMTDRTIIDWRSFDIDSGESVEFLQPGEWAAVLNRALGIHASQIDGALISNGRVYIANEAGIYFGGSAIVDVAQLVGAAGTISNQEFLSGIDHFQNLNGAVINRGEIGADSVVLAGKWVSNQGTIVVNDDALLLLAGDELWVTEIGSPILIQLEIPGGGPAGQADVENTGTLDAGRGRIRLAAGDPLGISIRNSGTIRAQQITLEGQDLVQVSGTLDASNESAGGLGGDIQVLGDRVALTGATLDASGDAGGGRFSWAATLAAAARRGARASHG